MSGKRVIIAEDDISTGIMLSEFLKSRGYSVESAGNGSEALQKYREQPSQVVITDIEMPVMDGNELISHLNAMEIPPVIFVTTSRKDPELIIDIMKKGVYDYILKPVDMSDLMLKLNRAFEAYNLKRSMEIARKEKIIRLENILEWYKFEAKLQFRDIKSMGKNIFESLLTSFNQGPGFGGLVSLISIMRTTAVKENSYYRIDNDLFETVMSNVASAEKALQTFADISKMTTLRDEPVRCPVSALYDSISEKIRDLETLISLKRHHLILSDKKDFFENLYIDINLSSFMKAFEELILNSLKFSPPDSEIIVIVVKQEDTCSISVINDINEGEKGHKGIPMGYENIVFEPFFRLSRLVYEEYKTLDYGLGLTLAEKIVTAYGGKIAISNINDYSDIKSGVKVKVECVITFPLNR